jgi:hypothetical protein
MLYVNEPAELTGTGTSAITKINLTTLIISVAVVCVLDKLFEIFLRCGLLVVLVEYVLTYSLHGAESFLKS